ncbi:hypothetical protein ACI1TN_04145 [Lactococcus garvieae]|nr:hypothetical protein [Lactococcus garvieae]
MTYNQHSTAQHSTAQHSTAQHNTTVEDRLFQLAPQPRVFFRS